ncbi:glutamine amidotransferase [Sorangium cellulosum]|uniref:Glutamine amidotransferase n=1 Tax=Sorangium cellulosum TaxID=56 RepID=A0A2L0EPJ0_SORCE|nr:class II glutamine amidotransferase [Sorangium cellulosum]AUX41182.1 glutamine amidotransferase [Sorangium cellulosum]
MCELLGMVSNVPTDIVFSFTGLALRGGQTGPHADGWGVSMYDGLFARTFLEPHPAYSSPLARFIRENPIHTALAIAHVRKMTRGGAALKNTHPFMRVLHRRHIVFAHNGTLPNVRDRKLRFETPIGDTDSEHAFCVILEELRAAYGSQYPTDAHELGRTLFELGNELGSDGVFNFLFADGEHLFARCGDHLSCIVRHAPFGEATLVDADVKVNFNDVHGLGPDARMAVVATEPLTRDELWSKATPGTLWVFRAGELLASFPEEAPGPASHG